MRTRNSFSPKVSKGAKLKRINQILVKESINFFGKENRKGSVIVKRESVKNSSSLLLLEFSLPIISMHDPISETHYYIEPKQRYTVFFL